jgi:hypothetical protein
MLCITHSSHTSRQAFSNFLKSLPSAFSVYLHQLTTVLIIDINIFKQSGPFYSWIDFHSFTFTESLLLNFFWNWLCICIHLDYECMFVANYSSILFFWYICPSKHQQIRIVLKFKGYKWLLNLSKTIFQHLKQVYIS